MISMKMSTDFETFQMAVEKYDAHDTIPPDETKKYVATVGRNLDVRDLPGGDRGVGISGSNL